MIGQPNKYYEDGIINMILIFPEDRPKIFNHIHADHFEPGGINRKIFPIFEKLYQEFKPKVFSTQVLIAEICTLLAKEKRNWQFWIDQFTKEAPIPTDINFYIGRIKRNYNKRRIIEISNAAGKRIEKGQTPDEVAAFTKNEYDHLEREKLSSAPKCFFDVAAECMDKLEQSDIDDLTGIKTGYKLIDKYILGMRAGDLVVIAGRPSMGKTTIATNISINAAKQGYCGLIFSLEMGQYRLGLRMIASETGTNLYDLSRGHVTDFNQLQEISGGLKNLYIDFDVNLNCQDIIARIREFIETKTIDFVVLDYLQKLIFSNRERHDLAVAEATGAFKNAAKEFNLPFILLSQLSRANEKDGKAVRKPRLSDLRDSGAIEQDADIVMFIHRQEVYEPEKEKYKNRAEIFIAKNRDGETKAIDLTFQKEINRFRDFVKETEY